MFFHSRQSLFSCQNVQKKAVFFCQYVFQERPGPGWALMACNLQNFMKSRFFGQKVEDAAKIALIQRKFKSREKPVRWGQKHETSDSCIWRW
jgi:hypothetical protein